MLDQCANPQCGKQLHYLRDGRVFTFETASGSAGADGKRMRRIEHFWLCGDCAANMIVECTPDRGISVHALDGSGRGGYHGRGVLAS